MSLASARFFYGDEVRKHYEKTGCDCLSGSRFAKGYTCTICGDTYQCMVDIVEHVKKHKEEDMIDEALIAGKEFRDEDRSKIHPPVKITRAGYASDGLVSIEINGGKAIVSLTDLFRTAQLMMECDEA